MKRRTKKALIEPAIMGGIILAMVVVIVIASIAYIYLKNTSKLASRQTCYTSLIFKSRSTIRGVSIMPIDINCKKNVVNKKVKDEDEAISILADEMYWCWWQFHQGKVDFLSGWWPFQTFCAICSDIKLKGVNQVNVSKLAHYLQTHQKGKETYWDFLGQSGRRYSGSNMLNVSNKVSVVFRIDQLSTRAIAAIPALLMASNKMLALGGVGLLSPQYADTDMFIADTNEVSNACRGRIYQK